MTIYISGKITGTDDYKERFAKAEELLILKGHKVINPVRLSIALQIALPFEPSYDDYMSVDRHFLDRAEAIYMLKGYEESNGARDERTRAAAKGIQILYEGDL